MKIFLITPFENRLAKRGTRFIDIADKLEESGYEVNYVTTNFSHAYKRFFTKEEIKNDKKLSSYKINYLNILGYKNNISIQRVISNFFMSINFYFFMKKNVNDGDIVMIPSRPVDFIFFTSLIKSIRKDIKLIMDIRDIWPDGLVKRNILFELYCNFFLNNSMKKYDAFIHIAPNFTNWLKRYNPDASSQFVPPGFNIKRWSNITPKIISNNSSKIKIVFIGALQYQLNIIPFLKSIKNNDKFEIYVLGENGKGQRYNEVIGYINLNKMKNVKFLGVVDPNDVGNIIKDFHIGLIPMISNSFTNKIFDYIACYLPIFNIGLNDMGDFVKKYDIGWSSSFNQEEIDYIVNKISVKHINDKINNIKKIRHLYERKLLYKKIVNHIDKLKN